MIYILGDSWSSTSIDNDREYPPVFSLPERIRRGPLGHQGVTVLAEPGQNNIDNLRKLSNLETRQGDIVVMGWTDFGRDAGAPVSGGEGYVPTVPDGVNTYEAHLAHARAEIEPLLDSAAAEALWVHWGATSAIWAELPDAHRVAYADYTHTEYNCPRRWPSLHTWCSHIGNPSRILAHMTTAYTSSDELERAATGQSRVTRWSATMTDLVPDGGHLAWQHYDRLAQKITRTATE
jgi:hypothetical protein